MTNDEKFQEWNAINKRFQAWWEKCKEEYDIAGTTSYEYAEMAFHARDAEIATLQAQVKAFAALKEYAEAEECRPHHKDESKCWCGEQRRAALALCEEGE